MRDETEKAQLTIRKGTDGELALGGLRFVACRREIEGIDGGVTLIVRGPAGAEEGDDRDLIRFDFFRTRPHFHVPAENQAETRIDGARHGDGFEWGVAQITSRMKALIEEAGFERLAPGIDETALAGAMPRLRALVAGLAEPTETTFFEIDRRQLEALGAALPADPPPASAERDSR